MPRNGNEAEDWAASEDDNLRILCTPYKLLGQNVPWRKLISKIPNRSVTQARNRWLRMNQPPTTRKDGRPPNRCLKCNLPFKGHTCRGVWIPDEVKCDWNEEVAAEGEVPGSPDSEDGLPLKWTFDMVVDMTKEELEKAAEEDLEQWLAE